MLAGATRPRGGKHIAGRYASTTRFLEAETGMTRAEARAVVGRSRDLDSHSTRVADAWLSGAIRGGSVRDLILGVNNQRVETTRDVERLSRSNPGYWRVTINRGGQTITSVFGG